MPDSEIVSMQEAQLRTTSGRRRQFLEQYAGYIQQLPEGQAGKLQPTEHERISTVRRRLTAAATMLGENLVIKRSGEELYFWEVASQGASHRRRHRSGDDAEGGV